MQRSTASEQQASAPAATSSRSRSPGTSTPRGASSLGTVGIWRLTSLLHRGSWCDLYAAQPADAAGSPRSDYAVKLTRQTSHEDPEAALQVRNEAAVAAVAKHQHLIPVLDGQVGGNRPYIVMPRINGATLETLLQRPVQPIPVALWWIRQCSQAVAVLHAAGWSHGDLKPENVLVDLSGHVTIVDLGFAQKLGSAYQLRTAEQAEFRGTPAYAAPELTDGSASTVTAASDIFSIGLMLRALLAEREQAFPQLVELLEQMTAEQPSERPTAGHLAEELLKLEIDTLHLHISPGQPEIFARRDAA